MTLELLTIKEREEHLTRFRSKVLNLECQDACWLWSAAKNKKGYGIFAIKGRSHKAHRVAYEFWKGPIPPGKCILHSCDNSTCVNPQHLTVGDRAENNRQICLRGRHKKGGSKRGVENCQYEKGEKHHAAKLTIQAIRQIRKDKAAGLSYSDLSKKYDIAIGHLHRIVHRKAWKHVE